MNRTQTLLSKAAASGIVAVLTCFLPPNVSGQTYNAGAALKAVEIKGGAKENPVGPWSYGQRSDYEDKDLTLLESRQENLAGDVNFPGWVGSSDGKDTNLGVRVNMGPSENIGFGWGAPGGPFMGDGTPDLVLHPSGGPRQDSYVVVRWTVPAPGTYKIDAFWRDISSGGQNGSEGVDVHLVVNGKSIFDGVVSMEEGSPSLDTTQVVTVARGDKVDFVVGPNANGDTTVGSADNDGTAFNATISLVPKKKP